MISNAPLITVTTSYYNDKAFLKDAIQSVLSSTYTNFEYILVDHASTDGSAAIAHSFQDPRIKHLSLPKNYGASGNILLQKALEIAQGEYTKILCADDMLAPQGLEKLLHQAMCDNADLVFGDVCLINEDKRSTGRTWFKHRYPAHLPVEEYIRCCIGGTSCFPYAGNFIRTSKLRNIPMDYVSVQLADIGLWMDLLLNGAKLTFVDDLVADYRIHAQQTCNVSNLDIIFLRSKFEHFLFCDHFFHAHPSLPLLKKIFPDSTFINQLTEEEADLFPFAITHAIYHLNYLPAEYKLAARIKLAKLLNDTNLQQNIEQKFGFSIADLRQDIIKNPIIPFSINYMLANTPQTSSFKYRMYGLLRKVICRLLLLGWNIKQHFKKGISSPTAKSKDIV